MEKLKKMIIIFFIILVIIIISLIVIIVNHNNNQEDILTDEVPEHEYVEDYISTEMEEVTDPVEYMTAIRYINEYLSIINQSNSTYYGYNEKGEYSFIADKKEIGQEVYNLLSNQYIEKNNVTVDNVWNHIPEINETIFFIPIEIGKYKNIDVTKYIVHGVLEKLENYNYLSDIYLIINFDNFNGTYSIEPVNEEYKTIQEVRIENIEETISQNVSNTYSYVKATEEDMAKEYFNNYKKLVLGNPVIIYNRLNKEYKEKRFPSLDEFKEYINQNKEQIKKNNIQKYHISIKDEGKQYICVDQNNNYYIFEENSIMDYNIILDIYTLDLPEAIQKYNNSTEEEKVLINIQKVFYAINSGDYTYVYNKLDETFKDNYFKTEESLENYLKENLYQYNKISYGKNSKNKDVYVYEISIKDVEDESKPTIQKKIVMQLKEGTDFVMSFNIE